MVWESKVDPADMGQDVGEFSGDNGTRMQRHPAVLKNLAVYLYSLSTFSTFGDTVTGDVLLAVVTVAPDVVAIN